jgi:hypothetical protein
MRRVRFKALHGGAAVATAVATDGGAGAAVAMICSFDTTGV